MALNLAMINARAIGFASTKNMTCAYPLTDQEGEPLFESSPLTLHHLMIFIAAPCLGLTILSTMYLSWRHLHRYTAPQAQRQILRIVCLPTAYAIFNFLALTFWLDYQYVAPIAGVYEAFCVAALFLLLLEYACPDGTDREKYFNNMPNYDKKGDLLPGGSLQWFQRTWASVFQYPVTKPVFVAIEITTQYYHVYCENSFSYKYAHLWLTIADYVLIGGALGATIKFAQKLKKEKAVDRSHGARSQVFSFIGILIFQLLQDVIFGLLNGKLFEPSAKATYNDINFGIPAFLTCVESCIFSLIFHWAFSSKQYHEGTRMDRLGAGPATRTHTFKAILDALNLADIVSGSITAFQLLFMRVQSRYGARSAPRREKLVGQDVGMEPLSSRNRMRGYSGGSEHNDAYNPPLESPEYQGGLYRPQMPGVARDTSPSGRARTYRADDLRPQMGAPQEYQPLTGSRAPSPSGMGEQYPRQMV